MAARLTVFKIFLSFLRLEPSVQVSVACVVNDPAQVCHDEDLKNLTTGLSGALARWATC